MSGSKMAQWSCTEHEQLNKTCVIKTHNNLLINTQDYSFGVSFSYRQNVCTDNNQLNIFLE